MTRKSKSPDPNAEVWAIRHKETGEFWQARSGKTSWRKANHAASAWAQGEGINEKDVPRVPCTSRWCKEGGCYHCDENRTVRPKFREQDTYECVRLESDVESELTKALARIKELEANEEKLKGFYLRQMARLKERAGLLKSKHKGNEDKFTYHGGYDLGYLEGQIRAIDDVFKLEAE